MQHRLFCRDFSVTPTALAALYAAAFPNSRPWSATEFDGLLAMPTTFLVTTQNAGFALGRVIVDEAELITLAVAPDAQRRGLGRMLLADFEITAHKRGACRLFLEVAADNPAALTLYQGQAWRESARRRGYYKRANGPDIDALIFEKHLT